MKSVPRVFISYSWTSQEYQNHIRQLAERLRGDGVDVVLDQWDLNEGDDKYKFMESMVKDKDITHVLVFSDAEYASKADDRKAGVGTETQIISQEVYSRTKEKESKFIPIVCEFDDTGKACLPTFLKSLKWIDFSSPESVNQNWEQLIRALHGKPLHKKPILRKPPPYITEDNAVPASPVIAAFATLKEGIIQRKQNSKHYRQDFLDACYEHADNLRIRSNPNAKSNEEMGKLVLETCGNLMSIRNHIVDWVLLESEINPSEDFNEALLNMLEKLVELKLRPPEVNPWSEAWFEAHRVFVYETFLYIVAALMKTGAFNILHDVFKNRYLQPETEAHGIKRFAKFDIFCGYSETLQILAPENQRLHSPAAELIKRQANRTDLPFEIIIEAELLVLMMACITENTHWHAQTLYYSSNGNFPFFLRAAQRRGFKKIATITGIENADELRESVKAGLNRFKLRGRHSYWFSFEGNMAIDSLDTLD